MKYPEIEPLVAQQLRVLGYDPDGGDLRDTPRRVARAWEELLAGKDQRAEDVLGTVFDLDYPGMVISRGIPFYSLCEHHLIPFFGRADVAYIPETGKVVGLSKLARLVEMHARRLQIQERMARDIAADVQRVLAPKGVAVVVTAQHFCMCSRGVSKSGSEMITPVMLGVYFDQAPARAELMALLNQK